MKRKPYKFPFEDVTGRNWATAAIKRTCARILYTINKHHPTSLYDMSLYMEMSEETLKIGFEALGLSGFC